MDGELIGLGKVHEPLEKLGTMALILWSVIQIDQQGANLGVAFSSVLPPQFYNINQTVAGH